MTNDETIALRVTVIGGQSYADDFTVIWRGLPIRQDHARPGLSPHVPQWRWTSNVYGKPGGGGGSGVDLDDCKRQFRAAWSTVRAGLTEQDIERAHAYPW